MSTMISEVYDALKDAGASEAKAKAAAEALAGYENRFSSIENKIAILEGKITLLQWMVGFNLAISVTMLFKTLA